MPGQTNQCVFDWSGAHLFLTSGDGSIKVVDYPSYNQVLDLSAHTSSCYATSMSPSGEYLAAGGGDALVSLWDTQEWICVRTFDLTKEPVKSVDFSFDGSYVTAGSDDKDEKRIKIAHVESGEVVHEISCQKASSVVVPLCAGVLAGGAGSEDCRRCQLGGHHTNTKDGDSEKEGLQAEPQATTQVGSQVRSAESPARRGECIAGLTRIEAGRTCQTPGRSIRRQETATSRRRYPSIATHSWIRILAVFLSTHFDAIPAAQEPVTP
jgi:hypothetical protein